MDLACRPTVFHVKAYLVRYVGFVVHDHLRRRHRLSHLPGRIRGRTSVSVQSCSSLDCHCAHMPRRLCLHAEPVFRRTQQCVPRCRRGSGKSCPYRLLGSPAAPTEAFGYKQPWQGAAPAPRPPLCTRPPFLPVKFADTAKTKGLIKWITHICELFCALRHRTRT